MLEDNSVCLNTDLLCSRCIQKCPRACRKCNKWECSQCAQDTETPQHFERCNETDPRVFENDFNIRDETPYKDLNICPCMHCPRRVCKDEDCGAECIDCHRRACWVCKSITMILNHSVNVVCMSMKKLTGSLLHLDGYVGLVLTASHTFVNYAEMNLV